VETLAGPISPELVLVDPALRAAILNSIQLRDRRDRFDQHRVDQDERGSRLAGADEGAAAEAVSPLSTLQWWLAVSVYSVIIVVLVLAVFFAARQL
jgi:hypothetical protein